MKRSVLALLLVLCLLSALFVPAAAVEAGDDVTRTLKTLEIMVGDETGALGLDRAVTRAEFAKLLVASSDQADAIGGQGAGYSLFTDVKSAHWASEYIKLCLDKGWMIGYTDGSFRPDNIVTLEEACTAALRLLGYDTAALAGSFPTAQLNKAGAVGLLDDLTAAQGQALTRADCAQLFYNLLTCKTAQGQVYALGLGYTLDSDGLVDCLAVAKEDMEGPFLWTSGSALGYTPTLVYVNDRQVEPRAPDTGDVYYTNAALGVLWVYTDQIFGQITALSPTVGRPETVSLGGKSYALATDEVKSALSALGDNAVGCVVTLYLGMDGEVVDAETVNGPFVAGVSDRLPFTPETVYRNGVVSSSASLNANDVYYYSALSKTAWVYTDQVSGRIQDLTPNALSPTAVTVSGKSYTLGSDALSREVSTLNGKWTDRFVTLLFGMDGSVVKILSGDAVSADYYGVVLTAVKTAVEGAVEQRVTVLCTDGQEHVFPVDPEEDWEEDDLVRVTVTGDGAEMTPLTSNYLSGTVNNSASRVGDVPFADDVQILDLAEDGAAVKVEPSDLAGLTLSSANVRFYTLNSDGRIDRLILRDATGKLWSYGYVSAIDSIGSGMNAANRYTLLLDGQVKTLSASGKSYPVTKKSGAAVRLAADGSISAMESLKSAKLTSLGKAVAYTTSQSFALAEDVAVWMMDGDGDYYAVELSDVNAAGFTLTGWYDVAQKQIRLIVAETAG